MSEMLQRIARIIEPRAWDFYDKWIDTPAIGAECRHEVLHSLSVAAEIIAAMSEPTDEIAKAISLSAWHSGSGQKPENVWKAGLAAALLGPPLAERLP